MSPAPPRITFELTKADEAALAHYQNQRNPETRRVTVVSAIVGLVAVPAVLAFVMVRQGESPWLGILPGLGVASVIFYQALFGKPARNAAPRRQGGVGSRRITLELTPEAVLSRSEHGETQIPWARVEAVEMGPAHLFILTGPLVGVPVPLNAFESPAVAQWFMDQVHALRRAASAQPEAEPKTRAPTPDGDAGSAHAVEFRLTPEDLHAAARLGYREPKMFFGLVAMIGGGAATGYLIAGLPGAIIAFLFSLWFWLRFLPRLNQKQILKEDSPLLARQWLSISEAGLVGGNERIGSGTHTWGSLKQVRETSDLILIDLVQGGALMVPRRAFASEEQAASFRDEIRRHLS